ncbi:D-aminoacyl-tRNA deacylase [Sunxiuqinia sp. sy24]|uniref:D-aminoacyl-tRNA deacylase n=1 Tax=Sunxiuqinia sp. sy24 TaxID=3461495 RepID=UPI004045D38D
MRVVIQRVSKASVTIRQEVTASINQGLLILLGIEDSDNDEDIQWLVKKISQLRIFDDENGVMNQSLQDVDGQALVVSQFTLHANTKKGNRPSYIRASKPEIAIPLYKQFVHTLAASLQKEVPTGKFGANMQIELLNDGPVTIIIDSKNKTF